MSWHRCARWWAFRFECPLRVFGTHDELEQPEPPRDSPDPEDVVGPEDPPDLIPRNPGLERPVQVEQAGFDAVSRAINHRVVEEIVVEIEEILTPSAVQEAFGFENLEELVGNPPELPFGRTGSVGAQSLPGSGVGVLDADLMGMVERQVVRAVATELTEVEYVPDAVQNDHGIPDWFDWPIPIYAPFPNKPSIPKSKPQSPPIRFPVPEPFEEAEGIPKAAIVTAAEIAAAIAIGAGSIAIGIGISTGGFGGFMENWTQRINGMVGGGALAPTADKIYGIGDWQDID